MTSLMTGLPVSIEFNEVFVEVVGQAAVRDVPKLDGAVFGAAGDDVVVKRVPFNVGNGSTVPVDLKKIEIENE
jgi:hypothetical protein